MTLIGQDHYWFVDIYRLVGIVIYRHTRSLRIKHLYNFIPFKKATVNYKNKVR